jgi:cysteinyl-tRNA synthetase
MSAFLEFVANLLSGPVEIAANWPLKNGPAFKLHNTLTNKLEPVEPLKKGEILMYNCGPTPYDRQHIGNMVPPVFANLLRSALEAWGYKVKQVMNITDFGHLSGDNQGDPNIGDDKMMRGLKQEGLTPNLENMRTLAEKYAEYFLMTLVCSVSIPARSPTRERASISRNKSR